MKVKKFRKKPVEVTAWQTEQEMYIDTLEGKMHAVPGDWIITGVHGEQYPCKPDIFEETYEPVEEPEQSIGSVNFKEMLREMHDFR